MRRWFMLLVLTLGGDEGARAGEPAVRGLPPRESRCWTSVSGSTVEARLVFNYGVWAQLEEPDGGRLWVRCVYLSDADKEYLRSFGPTRLTLWQRVKAPKPEKIDINSCSLGQLKMLPRIGDALARRIVKGRPYRKTRDLLDVQGIGEKTFDGFRHDITAVRPKREPAVPEPRLKLRPPRGVAAVP